MIKTFLKAEGPDIPTGLIVGAIAALLIGSLVAFFGGIPLKGALVRYRANYVPKRLQLDSEAGEVVPDALVNSYFGILRKTARVEGFAGLFKGIWPAILNGLVSSLVIQNLQGTFVDQKPTLFGVGILIVKAVIALLIALPMTVLTYRTIVTPYKLPTTRWRRNLRILFTPAERARIWKIYTTPGLLVAMICQILLVELEILPLPAAVVLNLIGGKPSADLGTVKLILLSVLSLSITALTTPLDVVVTKLAVQQNDPSKDLVKIETEGVERYARDGDDVVRLREDAEVEPYNGIIDCIKKICAEEGWTALYRAWWLSLLGSALIVSVVIFAIVFSGAMKKGQV